jgi:hypothetical protein
MTIHLTHALVPFAVFNAVVGAAIQRSEAEPTAANIEFVRGDDQVAITISGRPFAEYVYSDATIPRPFFANVRAPNGVQVTRNHPPIEGQDLADHATFHPGIWMSFGDLGGSDYWRNRARVRHVEFAVDPRGGTGRGEFAVRNQYLDQHDPNKVVCQEIARYTILARPSGYLLLWDSTFSSEQEFAFGDQEEMGVGFRVATPLRVGSSGKGNLPPGSGTILDARGRKNENEVWGNAADWCDYSGTLAGQHVGLTIFCHPKNFRPSWYHARDYGLLQANLFGRQAFGKGEKSSLVVRPGEHLHLRYGILIHCRPEGTQPDYAAAFQDYLRHAGE